MNIRKTLYYNAHRLIGSSVGNVYERYLRQDLEGVPSGVTRQLLVDLLDHCAKNVPYYAQSFTTRASSFHDDPSLWLKSQPILTKEELRHHHDELQSMDLNQRKWMENTSGGSTGEPVRFIQDRAFWDRQIAVQMLSYDWAGRKFGEPALRIWGSERDILAGSMEPKRKILNKITNDVYLNAFRMTDTKMREFIQVLNTQPPKLIIAYVSAVYELALFAERENIQVAPQSAILTSAGTLYPFMRQKIESVFQCQVFNRYGSREVGDIASECQAHTGLHVFPWSNYVEIVDEEGQPVPDGVEGDIVVTCLMNYAMPLVRYAIGDRGILAPTTDCPCGRETQILQKVSGRNVDAFVTKEGILVDGEYFTHLLYFRDWVQKFQVVQKAPTQILFKIVQTDSDAHAEELAEIATKAKAAMDPDCEIDFEFLEEITPSKSGKYRYTISEVQR